jgi:hypothetical protein
VFAYGFMQCALADAPGPATTRENSLSISTSKLIEYFNVWQLKLGLAEMHRKTDLGVAPMPLFRFPPRGTGEVLAQIGSTVPRNHRTVNCDPERPDDAIARILEGCSPYDGQQLKKYIEDLEQFRTARVGFAQSTAFNAGTSLAHNPGRPIKVAEYTFVAVDSIERSDREFALTIFKDRTSTWHDEQGKLKARATMKFNLDDTSGRSRAIQELAREDEFTLEATISETAYLLLVEKEGIMTFQEDVSDEILTAIDESLAEVFWSEINPKLPNRLTRVFAK